MNFVDEMVRNYYLSHSEHDELKKVFIPILDDLIVFD